MLFTVVMVLIIACANVANLLLVTGVNASAIPVARATRVDPMVALASE